MIFFLPVVTGTTEIVTEGLEKYLEIISGMHVLYFVKNSSAGNITQNKVNARLLNMNLSIGVYHQFKRTIMKEKCLRSEDVMIMTARRKRRLKTMMMTTTIS